jgi:tRNA(fMet)-specific endonuclease VapC
MKYMFDTDICSYAVRNRSPALDRRLSALVRGDACMSVITYGELLFGAHKSSSLARMKESLAAAIQFIQVMPLAEDVADTYGSIRTHLERKGTPIGANDLWIGAHALAMGLILVTNNDREFKRIPKLKVENWTK